MKHQSTKEAIREWLLQRQTSRAPLPPIDQIRRELRSKGGERLNAKAQDKQSRAR